MKSLENYIAAVNHVDLPVEPYFHWVKIQLNLFSWVNQRLYSLFSLALIKTL